MSVPLSMFENRFFVAVCTVKTHVGTLMTEAGADDRGRLDILAHWA